MKIKQNMREEKKKNNNENQLVKTEYLQEGNGLTCCSNCLSCLRNRKQRSIERPVNYELPRSLYTSLRSILQLYSSAFLLAPFLHPLRPSIHPSRRFLVTSRFTSWGYLGPGNPGVSQTESIPAAILPKPTYRRLRRLPPLPAPGAATPILAISKPRRPSVHSHSSLITEMGGTVLKVHVCFK